MDSGDLLARLKCFALAALKFYRRLPKTSDAQIPGRQFYKAATSAWMNYRSAKRGQSRPHFLSKLAVAVEEIDESQGWLEFMAEGSIAADREIHAEATELCAILTASLKTSRANWEAERRRRSQNRPCGHKFRTT
jgi:four helix bundle protein